jgi:hypothetical protein
MAYDDEKKRLLDNSRWYNEFFDDLHQILAKTAKMLSGRYDPQKKLLYYPKPSDRPHIPGYYMLGLGGASSIQVYIVLDPQLMEDQPAFLAEPSLIVVKYPRGDCYCWVNDYGLRVIQNNGTSYEKSIFAGKTLLTGEILAGAGKGTKFQAFQLLLDPFIAQQDLGKLIDEQIVGALNNLPDL